MSDYGVDVFCSNDFDPTMPMVSGPKLAILRLARRLYTPRGSCPHAPNDGIDIRDFLNTPTPTTIIAGQIRVELLKDEACLSADVTVIQGGTFQRREMTVNIAVELAEGPFSLVLSVNDVTVELLSTT